MSAAPITDTPTPGEIDEDRQRLDDAVKKADGFFATFAISSYSKHVVRLAARLGLSPNTITAGSLALAAGAAVAFGVGDRAAMVLGAVLLYLSFLFDCVDGQLARYTRRFSPFGGWLDATTDRVKESIVYAGLAAGAVLATPGDSVHAGDVWGLAVAALVLQVMRHMIDFSFKVRYLRGAANPLLGASLGERGTPAPRPAAPPRPVEPAATPEPVEPAVTPAGATPQPSATARRVKRTIYWARKIVVLPIGERFALIGLTAAFTNARVTFLALLCWGSLAFCYTLAGRLLRSLTR